MSRPIQLHVMLSEAEMASLRSLAESLRTSVSDTVRIPSGQAPRMMPRVPSPSSSTEGPSCGT